MNVVELLAEERRDLLDLIQRLSVDDWATPSLCDGWTVRDVVAHIVSYDELSTVGLCRLVLAGRGSADRMNDIALARYQDAGPSELGERVIAVEPQGRVSPNTLCSAMIHQQDIRRPLGRAREIPADRLQVALGAAYRSRLIGGSRRLSGLSATADDVEWARGAGVEVRGPGEALLMTMAGRPDALAELSGPGVAELRSRF